MSTIAPQPLPNHNSKPKRKPRKRNRRRKRNSDEIHIDGKRLKKIRMLGKGAYGKVFKVADEDDNHYAVKRVEYKENEGVYPDIIKEMDTLRRFSHHPNIVELCGWKWDDRVFETLMEYGGSPLHRFIGNESYRYRMELLPEVLWQLLNTIAYLHARGLVHRDLKPDNILIDEWIIEKVVERRTDDKLIDEGSDVNKDRDNETLDVNADDESSHTTEESIEVHVRLVDFGLSKTLALKRNTPKTSTLWYRAPENLAVNKVYDGKIDVWAIGCIIYEYCNNEVLFRGNATKDTLIRVFSTLGPNSVNERTLRRLGVDRDKLPRKWKKYRMDPIEDPMLSKLMWKCLQINPDDRATAFELLQDEYFTSKGYYFDIDSFERIDKLGCPVTPTPSDIEVTRTSDGFKPIDIATRNSILDWMFHISDIEYVELRPQTVFLGIEIFDRVSKVWNQPIKKNNEYKYIALACLDVAAKLLEIYAIELDWVYEYNNKEFYTQQMRKYRDNPTVFKEPPKKPQLSRNELKTFVNRINKYEQTILYLLDFYVYTPTAFTRAKKANPELDINKVYDIARSQVFKT